MPWAADHYVMLGRGRWHDDLQGIGKPNAGLWHVTRNFNVTYRFDEHGWRDIADNPAPEGTVAVLGCSTTYGWGVENDEAWPALVARDAWRRLRVINLSSPGWGPWQISWVLNVYLSNAPELTYDLATPPVAVFYAWFNFHLDRMSIRDLEGEDPVQAAARLLLEMKARCGERRIPFAVLLFTAHGNLAPDPVLEAYRAKGGTVVDLRPDCPADVFPGDDHPTATWHATVARAIARNAEIRKLIDEGLAARREPNPQKAGPVTK